jgi:hypothetical protein
MMGETLQFAAIYGTGWNKNRERNCLKIWPVIVSLCDCVHNLQI